MTTRSLTDDERRHFIRYTDTRRWSMLRRFPVTDALHDELLAQMAACSPQVARRIVGDFGTQLRATAEHMLADRHYRDAVRALPFAADDRVVAVGDSITADRLGWFELLAAAMTISGAPAAAMVNLSIGGNTTADVLERFDLLESARPSHVLLMLGTNDARLHGRTIEHRMLTTPETERNLRALLDLVVNGLRATAVVITPPAVDQNRIDRAFADEPLRWDAADVAEVARAVRKVATDALDLHTLTQQASDDHLEADGVHPTALGQQLILAHILNHLAGSDPPLDGRAPG